MTFPAQLVLATGNAGKRAEWAPILAALGVEVVPAELPSPTEDAPDAAGNALEKAHAAARATGLPALGDDVALEVDALGGLPGTGLRRWAEALGGWQVARATLAASVGSRATYRCALALAWPDGRVLTGEGAVAGTIARPRGAGPGLEPCFVPDGETRTLAELPPDARERLHHRARAWRALTAAG